MSKGTNTGPHSTVSIIYKDEQIEVDEMIAPLITEVWKAGIGTWMSCQEVDKGIAWVEFESVDDLLKLVNIVISYDVDVNSPYNRIEWDRNLLGMTLPDWEFRFSVMDILADDAERIVGGEVLFEATVGAYFPHEDIELMVSKLREFNKRNPSNADATVDDLVNQL